MEKEIVIKKLPELKISYYIGGHSKLKEYWIEGDIINAFSSCYFVQDGRLKIKTEEREIPVGPNSLVVVPAGLAHSVSFPSSDGACQYWMHFDMHTNDKGLFSVLSSPIVVSLSDTAYTERLFKEILKYGALNDIVSQMNLQSACFLLMAFYFDKANINYSISEQDSKHMVETAVAYIQENFTSSPSVESLAKMCHFNTSYFIRVFKKSTGITPHQYIQSLQIERAKNFLMTNELSVKQIASSVGFADVKHFSKIFKACTHLSPVEYRKRFCKGAERA